MVYDRVTTMHLFCARTLACQPCQNPGARATNEHIGLYSYLAWLRKGGLREGYLGCLQKYLRGYWPRKLSD